MSSKSASRKRSGPSAVSYDSSPRGGSSHSLHPRIHRPAMLTPFGGPVATFLTFLVLSCVIAPCRAQTSKIFQWQFTQSVSTSLPSCQALSITVKPFNPANDTHGTPPFYMMSFPVNNIGIPSTTLIGTDPGSLSWTVNQPIGAQLLLYVVDSQGSSGGVPPQLYTVSTGQSTQCIPPASTAPPFTVTANVTTKLTTCQPWGLTITGGTPPYNLTLAALNSPIITNQTLGATDDAFTFIDRADPNTQLIAAISDFTGRWASGTPIVHTVGSEDVTCTGLVSSSGNATQIKEAALAAQAALAASSRHSTAVVAGVVVTLLVLLLLASAGVYVYMRRRRAIRAATQVAPHQFEGGVIDGEPDQRQVEETGTQILSINSFIGSTSPQRSAGDVSRAPSHVSASTLPQRYASASASSSASAPPSVASNTTQSSGRLSVRNPAQAAHRGFANFPTASVRRSAKEIEAGLSSEISEDSEYSDASHSSSRPLVGRSQSAAVATSSGARAVPTPIRSSSVGSGGREVIFQHQDAGRVRELPPPYIDRGTQDQ